VWSSSYSVSSPESRLLSQDCEYFPSFHAINHFSPTLLLYKVMLKDGEGQSSEGVMGHWDHPVGVVSYTATGDKRGAVLSWRGMMELFTWRCVFSNRKKVITKEWIKTHLSYVGTTCGVHSSQHPKILWNLYTRTFIKKRKHRFLIPFSQVINNVKSFCFCLWHLIKFAQFGLNFQNCWVLSDILAGSELLNVGLGPTNDVWVHKTSSSAQHQLMCMYLEIAGNRQTEFDTLSEPDLRMSD